MSLFSFFKSSEKIKSLTAADFKEVIRNPEVQLVDVRTPEEYGQGSIDNALLIDICSQNFEKNVEKHLDVSRPVAVFCRSGARSMQAARILEKKGFSAVYNLRGGIMGWE